MQSSTSLHTYKQDSQQIIVSDFYILSCTNIAYLVQQRIQLPLLFGTSIPTSFNILVKMFLHLFHWYLLCVSTHITLVQSSTSL